MSRKRAEQMATSKRSGKNTVSSVLRRDYQLLILCLPGLLYLAVFEYAPIWGVQIAFKDFTFGSTIWNARWVGAENFIRFVTYPYFWRLMSNTLMIAVVLLLIPFPITIIFALVTNATRLKRFKRFYQTVVYAPHFISAVVLVGIITVFTSPRTGIINILLARFGIAPIFFLGTPGWFLPILTSSHVWQQCGWASILYLATLTSVPPELYESAMIDGASRWQRVKFIDIPAIVPTMVIILILRLGQLLSLNWQTILLMQNNLNIRTSEVVQTFVYKTGILRGDFSYAAAAGLFVAVINLILIVGANSAARALRQQALW
ncbi:MAG: sugar ABC transporter permease [Spirochaetaceae bacterium]|nr:MAG: sugar ABC transporter permease [Spirochaetaceae bacterium]